MSSRKKISKKSGDDIEPPKHTAEELCNECGEPLEFCVCLIGDEEDQETIEDDGY